MNPRTLIRALPGSLSIVLVALTVHGAVGWSRPVWMAYKSNLLNLQVAVPSDWAPVKKPHALAFRYEDLVGGTAAIGFLKSRERGKTIEASVEEEYQREGRPAGWQNSPARIAGMRAIKIVGYSGKNRERKIVHYYVQTPKGIYLIQCQATRDTWKTISPIFTTILTKIRFI